MSIKIYHGFKLNVADNNELQAVMDSLREHFETYYQGVIDEFYALNSDKYIKILESLDKDGYYNNNIVLFWHKTGWYGISFGHLKTLEKLSCYEEFGYWDNTDKPDEVSEAQWKNRKKIWDDLLLRKGSGIPAERGMTIDFKPAYFPRLPIPSKVLKK